MKFEVTIEEANLLLASLARQPYEAVAGLISKLQQQAQGQLAAPADPPAEASKAN